MTVARGTILEQKTNEAFYHELTYYEPDGVTVKDITNIDIYVEIRAQDGTLIARYTNISNVASGLVKITPTSGLYSIETLKATTANWTIGTAKSDILYIETRAEATETFYIVISEGITIA